MIWTHCTDIHYSEVIHTQTVLIVHIAETLVTGMSVFYGIIHYSVYS